MLFRLLLLVSAPIYVVAQSFSICPFATQVDSLIQVSRAYTTEWELDTAYQVSAQAELLARTRCGENTPAYGAACFNEGRVRYFAGEYDEAIPWYQQSLDIRATTLGKDHIEYGKSLNNLAIVYDLQGRYEAAEPLYLEAMALRKLALGRESGAYGNVLNNLATMYTSMGRFEEAEQLLYEALDIRKEVEGEESLAYAASLQNLGELYYQLSQGEIAERYLLRAKAIYIQNDTQESADYHKLISAIGNLYFDSDQPERALNNYQKVTALGKSLYGVDHIQHARDLNRLALANVSLQQYKKAENLFLRSLELLDSTSLYYAFHAHNLTDLFIATKQYEKALQWQKKVNQLLDNWLTPDHPRKLRNLRQGVPLKWLSGGPEQAVGSLGELGDNEKKRLNSISRHMTEREMIEHIKDLRFARDYQFSLAQFLPEYASSCYDEALFHKGYILQSSQRARHLGLRDSTLNGSYKILLALHRRLAAQYALPRDEQYEARKLEEEIRRLEKQLRRQSSDLAEAWEQPTWQNIQAVLSSEEAVIEFVHYTQCNPICSDTIIYAALLLTPEMTTPRLIPLCTESQLKSLLIKEDGELLEPNELYAAARNGEQLYKLLWRGIQEAIEELVIPPTVVYYANSGLLHRLQIGAIPLPKRDVLSDQFHLHQLGSTRQLLLRKSQRRVRSNGLTALLYGGVEYQLDTNKAMTKAVRDIDFRVNQVTEGVRGSATNDNWSPLPWTEVEVVLAEEILSTKGYTTRLEVGNYATENFLKQRLDFSNDNLSPKVLHLATHAYFSAEVQLEGRNGFMSSREPLMRSGLVLAGANYAWKNGRPFKIGQEDGILTALELSQLNLENTDLIILSACETGLGDIKDDEGVFGLQRACKIAGAEFVMMSLWQISDFQTQAFMNVFYQYWLEDEMTIPDAFHNAQSEMRRQFPNPQAWAGMILLE